MRNLEDNYFAMILPRDHMHELVREMRNAGFNVEETGLGFICHEETLYGKVLVLSAMRGRDRYRVKANTCFFAMGQAESQETH